MMVRGDRGWYDERTERSTITGNAELELLMGDVPLYLHGDTLFAWPDEHGKRTIQAHRRVRFHRDDLQGVCDTLIYTEVDSMIRMYRAPVLWSGADQISGDHIRIALSNGQAHELHVLGNAFMLSQVDSVHLDQVTGTIMTGSFRDNELYRIVAEGNSRTVYFVREEKEGKEEIIGVNRADCSKIAVGIIEGQVATVTFMARPEAILYPVGKAPPEELRMKGSDWRGMERPTDRGDIFRH
jgi:hypothetical protein